MGRALLALVLVLPLLLLAGCVAPELGTFRVQYQLPNATGNATNQTLNTTPAPLPAKLDLCAFGLPSAEDAQLEGNLTCRGETVRLEVRTLNNTSARDEFESCALFYLKDDAEGRYMERAPRMFLRRAILEGRSLVLWGEAGTLMRSDSAVLGWDPELGDLVPARVTVPGKEPERIGTLENASGTLDVVGSDPLLTDLRGLVLVNINVTETAAEDNADVLAYLRTGPDSTSASYYATLHRSPRSLEGGLARNHGYYFSFDLQRHAPVQLRQLLAGLAQNWLAWQRVAC